MYRYGTAVLLVGGHNIEGITGQLHIGGVAGYKEMALWVVSAGGTHDIHEFLIYFIQKAERLRFSFGAPAPSVPKGFPAAFLVKGLEHQLVGIVLKSFGNLFPNTGVFSHTFLFIRGEICPPAAVVVNVYHSVHSAVQYPINDLLYSRHITGVNGVILFHKI